MIPSAAFKTIKSYKTTSKYKNNEMPKEYM